MLRSMAEIQLIETSMHCAMTETILSFYIPIGLDTLPFSDSHMDFVIFTRSFTSISLFLQSEVCRFCHCKQIAENVNQILWQTSTKWENVEMIGEIQCSSNNCNSAINNKMQNVVKKQRKKKSRTRRSKTEVDERDEERNGVKSIKAAKSTIMV